jgi:hypothetical protein
MAGCGQCVHCIESPGGLERALPGLGILSSAYGSVRADTALCQLHNQFVRPGAPCAGFAERKEGAEKGEGR